MARPAGGLLGPLITIWLSVPLGAVNLLVAAAVLLEIAVLCVYRLERAATVPAGAKGGVQAEPGRVGGNAFGAPPEVIRSPHLLGVQFWVGLLSFGATIVYFEQANIVAVVIHGRNAQTRLFA
jgi:AAA family ATP:ADP antiporter